MQKTQNNIHRRSTGDIKPEALMSLGEEDEKLKLIKKRCLKRAGQNSDLISVRKYKQEEETQEIPHVFSLGTKLFGFIYIEESLYDLPIEQLEFIIAHELAHILKEHFLINIPYVLQYITLDEHPVTKEFLELFEGTYHPTTDLKPIQENITAQIEIEADNYAVQLQKTKDPAIQFLQKITKEKHIHLKHYHIEIGTFKAPEITYQERINAIKESPIKDIQKIPIDIEDIKEEINDEIQDAIKEEIRIEDTETPLIQEYSYINDFFKELDKL